MEEEKLIKTNFGLVGLESIRKCMEEMDWQRKESERLYRKSVFVLDHFDEEYIDDIGYFLTDICSYFNDCTRCPLLRICSYAVNGCDEVYNCESCPRVRICVRNKSPGLKEYLGGE